MENEMIMTNVEENIDNNVELTEGKSTFVEKLVIGGVVVGTVVLAAGIAKGAKRLYGTVTNYFADRKAAKIKEAECVDLGEEQIDSEEESD